MFEVKNLTCQRDERILFSKLSFMLAAKQILHITGANGAGKTSLLRLLCGLSKPVHGEIIWQQHPIQNDLKTYYQDLAYMAHADGIKLDLTPAENLRLSAALYSAGSVSIEAALHRVGLKNYAHALCHTLSAGQRRRVAWARLLLRQSRLWILDEPFTVIDVDGIAQLTELMTQQLNNKGLIILTSHQPVDIKADMMTVSLDRGAEA